MIWVDLLLNGLMLGGLYALFGLGLSLIFGVMRIANIAHGELVVGGAFMAFSISGIVPLPPVLLIILVTGLMFGLGWLLQSALINRVIDGDPMRPLLLTFGMSILTQNLLVQVFGADSRSLDVGTFNTRALDFGSFSIGLLPLLTFLLSLGLFGLLHWMLHHTDAGRVVRATSDDAEIVALMGVNKRRVFSGVMALSAALAALAGMLLAMRSSITPFSGAERLLIAFEVVVIGGLGSIWASLLGGLVLGLVHAISFRFDPGSGLLYGHLLLLSILLIRPQGLAGKRSLR
jgi:branched-chain amino acid transport system permease protein